MGMCIVYTAIQPEDLPAELPQGQAWLEEPRPEQLAFGRRGPIALAACLAPASSRDLPRAAARELRWGAYLARPHGLSFPDSLALAAIVGGAPARAVGGHYSVLDAELVDASARALEAIGETGLRAAYALEREHVGSVLDEAATVSCFNALAHFYSRMALARAAIFVHWEYR